jgi:hypothetical protein
MRKPTLIVAAVSTLGYAAIRLDRRIHQDPSDHRSARST